MYKRRNRGPGPVSDVPFKYDPGELMIVYRGTETTFNCLAEDDSFNLQFAGLSSGEYMDKDDKTLLFRTMQIENEAKNFIKAEVDLKYHGGYLISLVDLAGRGKANLMVWVLVYSALALGMFPMSPSLTSCCEETIPSASPKITFIGHSLGGGQAQMMLSLVERRFVPKKENQRLILDQLTEASKVNSCRNVLIALGAKIHGNSAALCKYLAEKIEQYWAACIKYHKKSKNKTNEYKFESLNEYSKPDVGLSDSHEKTENDIRESAGVTSSSNPIKFQSITFGQPPILAVNTEVTIAKDPSI